MAIYVYKREEIPSFTCTFCYTGSDQHYTVPYPGTYTITAKGAGSYTSAGGLACGDFALNTGDELSIMVGQEGSVCCCGCTYGFGGRATTNCRNGGGLSGVFTGCNAITACDSDRALVIGGGAGGGYNATCYGGKGGGECGQNGSTCGHGTAGAGGTQTGHGSGGNVGENQFNGGNGSCCAGHGGGGGRWGGNGSKGDSSCIRDDKGAGGGSGYVKSTATNPTLTQGGGATACNNGEVKITLICGPIVSTPKVIGNIYLGDPGQDPGWRPGANTIAYYPLTTNANDASGHGYNLTAAASITYNSDGAYMPNSNHAGLLTPFSRSVSGSTTISVWRKGLDDGNSDDQRDVDYTTSGSNRFIGAGFYNRNQSWNSMIGNTWTATTPMNYNEWQLLTVTINNGAVIVYINGTQKFTGSMSSGSATIRFGNEYNLGADRHRYGYMKDIIFEDKIRTAEEVADYYNQTKSDYGIS